MALNFQLDNQQILEEDYDENYEPTEEEVLEYCKVLGLDPTTEKDLLYIAREGIKAPLPEDWKPIEDSTGNIYYFNFSTGESTWEHPCDEFYRNLLEQEREKRAHNPPSDQQGTENMVSKGGKKKGVTLKGSKLQNASVNGRVGAPLRNGGGAKSVPMNGSPGHGKLAPLSLGGGKPLPNIGGLPPLKTPSSLAPLRPPPSVASSLGTSLTSTGGSRLTDPVSTGTSRGGGGQLDLGSVRISTKFEEEDSESESDSRGGAFKSKLGVNLLGAEDLGLKESDDELDSTEDVSKELRKIMDMSSDRDENSKSDHSTSGVARPSAPLPSQSAALRGAGAGESPVSSPRLPRPGAARSRDRSNSNGQLPSPLHSGANSPSWKRNGKVNGLMSGSDKGASGSLGMVRVGEPASPEQVNFTKAKQSAQSEHEAALKSLREYHQLKLKQLESELAEQLGKTEVNLSQENETKLVSFREQLAREQLSEEKKLRAEKTSAVNELRVRLKGEREDEEAHLEEEKQDYLRKLKQQLSNEREREEKRLRDELTKALTELSEQLSKEQGKAESVIRSRAASELSQMKDQLQRELEEERDKVKLSLEEELKSVRRNRETELEERRAEIEAEHQKQLDHLQELREKQEQELKGALEEIEKSNSLEKAKEDALEAHQKAVQEVQAEFTAALEKEREESREKHEQEMEKLKAEFDKELTQTKSEWSVKIVREKESLSAELKSTKDSLKQEHEVTVQSLMNDFQTAQAELQQKTQQQTEEMTSLQADHSSKVEELRRQKQQVDQEQAELESRKNQLQTQKEELQKEEERLVLLRAATAQERDELLDKQQPELKAGIEREKEALAELKRSHSSVQSELLKLQEQKLTVQNSLEELQRQEAIVNGQLSVLKDKVKKHKDLLCQIKRDKKHSSLERAEKPQEVQKEKAIEPEPSEQDETAGAMAMEELETPGGGESSESEALDIEEVKERLEANQRELHSTLTREQESLNHTKEFLSGQRRADSKQAHRQKKRNYSQPLKNRDADSNLSLLKEIRTKLDQEAAVLSELEEKMRQSDKALAQKQRMVGEIQTKLKKELEDMSEEDSNNPTLSSDDLSIDIPSPKIYLTKLQASLERSRRYTKHPSSSRARHLSSPLPSRHSFSKHRRRAEPLGDESSGVSSDSELGSPPSSSAEERKQLRRPRSFSVSSHPTINTSHFSPATRKIMEESQRARGALDSTHISHRKQQPAEQSLIFDSLNMINSQLGKLLTRLPETSPTVRPLPPPVLTGDYTGLPSSGAPTSPVSTNRWAEPVQRFHQTDMDLQGKRPVYFGTRPNVTPSLGNSHLLRSPAVRPQRSTEELIHSQTDWLKEFRQSVPLSSQQSLRSKSSHAPSMHTSGPTQPKTNVLPSKPKLVLDCDNNVKLVHI